MPIRVEGDLSDIILNVPTDFLNRYEGVLRIEGRENVLTIGNPRFIGSVDLTLRGHAQILIGEGMFCHHLSVHAAASNASILIGKNNFFNGRARVLVQEPSVVSIGSDCMFATDVEITCGDFHGIFDARTGKRINPVADIVIEDHVWLGTRSTILKGAHIAKDTVVGLGSIVTRKFPAGVILAGVPAKVIRRRVTWTK